MRKCCSRDSGDRHIPARRWCSAAIARYSVASCIGSSPRELHRRAGAETNHGTPKPGRRRNSTSHSFKHATALTAKQKGHSRMVAQGLQGTCRTQSEQLRRRARPWECTSQPRDIEAAVGPSGGAGERVYSSSTFLGWICCCCCTAAGLAAARSRYSAASAISFSDTDGVEQSLAERLHRSAWVRTAFPEPLGAIRL